MGNIDLIALEIFKAVAEQGGITRAAARLHRVQSNVTTRVKQLEARLGTKLFLRQSRRLVLSPEGKLLLAYADRLLRLSAEAEAALQSGAPSGTLQLGALESTAATRLPPVLSRYHRTYPDVRIELVTGTTGALIAKVSGHEVEAALVAEPFTAGDLEAEPVFSEDLVLIAPKSLPRIRTPKDIGRTTLIAFATGCSYRRRLEAWDRDRAALGAPRLPGGARRGGVSAAGGRRQGAHVPRLAAGPALDGARGVAGRASARARGPQRSVWRSEAAMRETARVAVSMSRPIGTNPWIIPP